MPRGPVVVRLWDGFRDVAQERNMQASDTLRTLRAVRRFSAQPIPDVVVQDMLDVVRWTGSAKNTQPWELVVVSDQKVLAQLGALGRYAGHLADARLAVVLVMDSPGQDFDAGRLAQNIMLAAWMHGVGSCIGTLAPEENERRAKDLLAVPAARSLRTAISLGYPADDAARLVRSAPPATRAVVPTGRKPLAALVSWERYGQHQRD
jgi:nitroreductase